jgi:enoyl-CoA hydratase/carnithine racemase
VQVNKEEIAHMAWDIEGLDGCVVVRMNTNKVNIQNDHFFADLHAALDRLEREFSDLPVVLTGQGDVFSGGIDFQDSCGIFGTGSAVSRRSRPIRCRSSPTIRRSCRDSSSCRIF